RCPPPVGVASSVTSERAGTDFERYDCYAQRTGILYTTMPPNDHSPRTRVRVLPEIDPAEGPRVSVAPIATSESFKRRAYAALKDVIVAMDVYRSRADIRLDERRLAHDFGLSRP